MTRNFLPKLITVLVVVAVVVSTRWAVGRFHTPGQLDVVTAQAMDMSAMRPPTGAAPVALASVRRGALTDTVTYTGTVRAFNQQDITPRITGTVIALPVYPGDTVRAGQIVARLDTAEVGAKADEAAAAARQATLSAQAAGLTQTLQRQAAAQGAAAAQEAAAANVAQAQSEAQAAADATADARAGVQSAQANADYWKTEIVRERQLADAGAVSRQEYQNEAAQAAAAQAALTQARAKVRQSLALAAAARAKTVAARQQQAAAGAGLRAAQADVAVAAGDAATQRAAADAARAAAHQAEIVRGYAQIASPADGVVTARPVAPGTLVQPGTVLLQVAEINRVRVQASVAAADLAGVGVGTPVTIVPQSTGQSIKARVSAVFPSADAQTRTAIVEAVVPNPDHRLLPGAFVTMQIVRPGASDGLRVPASAVVSDGGGSFVWLAQGGASSSSAPTRYQCEKCHMIYSAADAKKNNYHDPMDGGRLIPLPSSTSAVATGGPMTAHRVPVQVGPSDGMWTQVSGDVPAGSRVVTRGQAGLAEGAALAVTNWGADGPQALPGMSAAAPGQTLYRCEKCGMTYSAADAKRNHYVDPMDGGALVPVAPAPSPASGTTMPGMKM